MSFDIFLLRSLIAESTGFEPVDTLRYRQFSKLLVSATHPTLRSAVTLKRCAKITLFRNNAKIIAIKFSLGVKILPFEGEIAACSEAICGADYCGEHLRRGCPQTTRIDKQFHTSVVQGY